jgi:hypothetical protein
MQDDASSKWRPRYLQLDVRRMAQVLVCLICDRIKWMLPTATSVPRPLRRSAAYSTECLIWQTTTPLSGCIRTSSSRWCGAHCSMETYTNSIAVHHAAQLMLIMEYILFIITNKKYYFMQMSFLFYYQSILSEYNFVVNMSSLSWAAKRDTSDGDVDPIIGPCNWQKVS